MMAERLRTVSVGGDCESDIGAMVSDLFSSSIHSEPSLMNTSQISTSSQDSQRLLKPSHNLQSKKVNNSLDFFEHEKWKLALFIVFILAINSHSSTMYVVNYISF